MTSSLKFVLKVLIFGLTDSLFHLRFLESYFKPLKTSASKEGYDLLKTDPARLIRS